MGGKPQSEEKNAMDKSLRSDQPICSGKEDLLTRDHLAKAIGECILATRKPESIALNPMAVPSGSIEPCVRSSTFGTKAGRIWLRSVKGWPNTSTNTITSARTGRWL